MVVWPLPWTSPEKCGVAPDPSVDPDHFELMTCEEILTGKVGAQGHSAVAFAMTVKYQRSLCFALPLAVQGEHFPGLVPIIFTYLDIIECDDETRDVVSGYLYLIVQRAKGKVFSCWALPHLSLCVPCHSVVRLEPRCGGHWSQGTCLHLPAGIVSKL